MHSTKLKLRCKPNSPINLCVGRLCANMAGHGRSTLGTAVLEERRGSGVQKSEKLKWPDESTTSLK